MTIGEMARYPIEQTFADRMWEDWNTAHEQGETLTDTERQSLDHFAETLAPWAKDELPLDEKRLAYAWWLHAHRAYTDQDPNYIEGSIAGSGFFAMLMAEEPEQEVAEASDTVAWSAAELERLQFMKWLFDRGLLQP